LQLTTKLGILGTTLANSHVPNKPHGFPNFMSPTTDRFSNTPSFMHTNTCEIISLRAGVSKSVWIHL